MTEVQLRESSAVKIVTQKVMSFPTRKKVSWGEIPMVHAYTLMASWLHLEIFTFSCENPPEVHGIFVKNRVKSSWVQLHGEKKLMVKSLFFGSPNYQYPLVMSSVSCHKIPTKSIAWGVREKLPLGNSIYTWMIGGTMSHQSQACHSGRSQLTRGARV